MYVIFVIFKLAYKVDPYYLYSQFVGEVILFRVNSSLLELLVNDNNVYD